MWAAARRTGVSLCGCAAVLCGSASEPLARGGAIPPTRTTALDGHGVSLPHDLPARATVLIVGFGRHSADATTAWEKPVRTQLARPPGIGFFDLAMLAEVPGFVRPLVVRAIRREVPDVLKPNFLPLFDHEEGWKRVAGFAGDQPESAYVLVVDRAGAVRWSTHAGFTQAGFAQLRDAATRLAGEAE